MVAAFVGITGMDVTDPHYRDCIRDVVAMIQQCHELSEAAVGSPEFQRAGEGLKVLLGHADTDACLKVAVSMLATSWQMITHARAGMRGTTPDDELADIFAHFRDRLA